MATRPWLGIVSFLILLATQFSPCTYAATKGESDPQLVRLRYLQGDVRFNRGDGKNPDLKQPWEVATMNLSVAENYALATGNGRAAIEFESGSVVYVDENTVVIFQELTSTNDVPTTILELVSGTATAGLQPIPGEYFEIDTPTQQIQGRYPAKSFVRIDAYLDGMQLTAQMDANGGFSGDARRGLMKGQTVTIPDGAPASVTQPGQFRMSDDFDNWARADYESRSKTMEAALKASGFSSPTVGLADMYESGIFTPCAPYGMCWEPKPDVDLAAQESARQSGGDATDQAVPASGAQNNSKPFKPVEVSTFVFRSPLSCPFGPRINSQAATGVGQEQTAVARTPEELRELQMRGWNSLALSSFPTCHYARWVHQGGRYRTVIRRKRVHHPIRWVKVGKKTGFVPASPLDKKGQAPANLRHGIYVPSEKNGKEQIERVDFDPKQTVEMLSSAPKEFRSNTQTEFGKVERPEIRGRLLSETSQDSKVPKTESSVTRITYDYHKGSFVQQGVAVPGHTSKPLVVGSLDSHGGFSGRDSGRSRGWSSEKTSSDDGRSSSASRSTGSSGGGSRSGGSESRGASSSTGASGGASSSSSSSSAGRPR
jgi:hypothetical protein